MNDYIKALERMDSPGLKLKLPLITKDIKPDGVWTPGMYRR